MQELKISRIKVLEASIVEFLRLLVIGNAWMVWHTRQLVLKETSVLLMMMIGQ